MKEHPLLFNAPMIRALLDDANPKTQTRRPLRPQPDALVAAIVHTATVKATGCKAFTLRDASGGVTHGLPQGKHAVTADVVAPWAVGDRLWVRETFCRLRNEHVTRNENGRRKAESLDGRVVYRASYVFDSDGERARKDYGYVWTPSIHMPRWASRITLEVTEVRAQRVQDIGEEDAKAEGMSPCIELSSTEEHSSTYRCAFADLWGDVYGTWDRNDWVWATTFKRVLP